MKSNSIVYSELVYILEQVPYSYIKKLPDNIINKLKKIMSIERYNSLNKEKTFINESFDNRTIDILEKIKTRYWENQ